jgi:hypothetical protein
MFPFVPGTREVSISEMAILFRSGGEDGCPEIEVCPCPEPDKPACCVVEFRRNTENRGDDGDCHLDVQCFASDQWPDLYYGFLRRISVPSKATAITGRNLIFHLAKWNVPSCCVATRLEPAGRSPHRQLVLDDAGAESCLCTCRS